MRGQEHIAISTGVYPPTATFEQIVEAAGHLSVNGIEFLIGGSRSLDVLRQGEELRRLMNLKSIRFASVHFPFRIEGKPLDFLNELLLDFNYFSRLFEDVCSFAKAVNSKIVVVHAGGEVLPPGVTRGEAHELLAKYLSGLAEKARGNGLTLALENASSQPLMLCKTPEELLYVARKCRIGVCLDLNHVLVCSIDPEAMIRKLDEYIVHVHLSGVDGEQHTAITDKQPWTLYLNSLEKVGYAGLIVLEGGKAETVDAATRGLAKQVSLLRTRS
jgi:sugar phosphate isomerase/epimerase